MGSGRKILKKVGINPLSDMLCKFHSVLLPIDIAKVTETV